MTKLSLVQRIAEHRGLCHYKVPLYDEQWAELALPRNLTYEDAVRLGAFLFALAADPDSAETGETP